MINFFIFVSSPCFHLFLFSLARRMQWLDHAVQLVIAASIFFGAGMQWIVHAVQLTGAASFWFLRLTEDRLIVSVFLLFVTSKRNPLSHRLMCLISRSVLSWRRPLIGLCFMMPIGSTVWVGTARGRESWGWNRNLFLGPAEKKARSKMCQHFRVELDKKF